MITFIFESLSKVIMNNIYIKNKEIIKYLIVGILTTILSIFIYFVSSELLGFGYIVSNIFSWVLSIIFAFFMNKKIVFNSTDGLWQEQFVNFTGSRLITLVVEIALMFIFLNILTLTNMVAKVIAQLIIIVLNYIFGKAVFNKKGKSSGVNIYNKICCVIKTIDKNYLIIAFISLYILIPYMSNKIFTGHDIEFHITNIRGMIDSVQNGSLFPSKILLNDLNNFGYGAHIFYPCLLYYVVTYISVVFNFGIVGSLKLVFLLVTICSGIAIYEMVKQMFRTSNSGLLAAVFYITSSYYLTDLYIRFAFSELGIFIFAPLVFLGIHRVINKKSNLCLIIGATGMIYSHTVLTLYLIGLVLIYVMIHYKDVCQKHVIMKFIESAMIIILLTMPFILPMYEHKLFTDYGVFQNGHMVYGNENIGANKGIYLYYYFFNGTNNYLLEPMSVVLAGVSIWSIFDKKYRGNSSSQLKNKLAFLLMAVICIILTLKIIDWSKLPSVMSYIQFPWRLSVYIVLAVCVLAGSAINYVDIKLHNLIIIIAVALSFNHMTDVIQMGKMTEVTSKLIYSYADLGNQKEYLPYSAYNNLEYYENRSDEIIIIDGDGDIEIVYDFAPNMEVSIESNSELIVEMPRTFYLGYEFMYRMTDSIVEIPYYENENGFIECIIPSGNGVLLVSYPGTVLNRIANLLLILTVLGYTFISIKRYRKEKK